MLLNLVNEDDRVADDHAREREDAEVSDETDRLAREEHAAGDADDAQRSCQECDEHGAAFAHLEDQKRHDEEDHGGHGHEKIFHRILAVCKASVRLDGVSCGKILAQFLRRRVRFFRRIRRRARDDVGAYGHGGLQVAPPDDAVFRIIGNLRHLRKRHIACLRQVDRQFFEAREVVPRLLPEPQHDVHRAVALVEFRRFHSRQFRVEHLLHHLRRKSKRLELVLIEREVQNLALFLPVEVHVARVRIARHEVSNLIGKRHDFFLVFSLDAQHDGVRRRRPRLDELEVCTHVREVFGKLRADLRRQILA